MTLTTIADVRISFLYFECDQPDDSYCHQPKHVAGLICKSKVCLD